MSVIRKIPYIESVIGALSEEELATLQTLINTGSAGTPASISNLPSGIVAVHFTMPSGRVKDGILVKKSCLIGYDGTQRITAYKIANGLISESYEYCDINELRRIVFDVGNSGGFVNPMTTAGDIIVGGTDGEATRLGIGTQGQVLKVGSSGLEWATDDDNEIPSLTGNAGKVLKVNSGATGVEWSDLYPVVSIALTQVTGQNPLTIQLTDPQYNVFANNKQVLIDLSELGENSVVWSYTGEDSGTLIFGFSNGSADFPTSYRIEIDPTTKEARYYGGHQSIDPADIGTDESSDAGKLLAMDSNGWGILTNNLPVLTTAPSSANTEGGIIIVVLNSEPAQKFSGYLYIVVNS